MNRHLRAKEKLEAISKVVTQLYNTSYKNGYWWWYQERLHSYIKMVLIFTKISQILLHVILHSNIEKFFIV